MARKAFFIECSAPFWQTVAEVLEHEQGFVPVYWTGLSIYQSSLRSRFPQLLYHDCLQAKYGIPLLDASSLPTISMDNINTEIWEKEAQLVYDMLNRFDYCKDFSFAERRRYFRRGMEYWSAVLERFQPQLIVFPNPPHVAYDYIVYCLAQRRMIPTVMWDETAISEKYKYILTMESFEDGDVLLRERYRMKLQNNGSREACLTPNLREYLNSLRSEYAKAKPVNEQKVAAELAGRQTEEFHRNDRIYLQNVCRRELSVHAGFSPPSRDWLTSCWKQLGVAFEQSFSGPFSWAEFEFCQRWWWKESARRKVFYDSLAVPFQPEEPYVYVALAGQPERTSNPQGGIFTDQFLMVQVLSASVPSGWKVYVKEHPNQFNSVFHGHTCRDPEFYLDLASLPNVQLVRTSQSPFNLMDGAQAVATVAGTSGWEAIVRGIPALIFGAAWYRDCEGVLYTPTVASCREALSMIANGYRVDQRKVELFIETVREVALEGLSDPLPPEWRGLTDKENGRRLAASICRILTSRRARAG